MKRVLFTDEESGCAAMAAALFDQMVHPDLVTGGWTGAELPRDVGQRVAQTLRDAGVARPLPERADRPVAADRVVVLTDASAAPQVNGAAVEQWRLSHGPLASESDFRRFHDELRPRVWRLVAREGWYRLQPRPAKAIRRGRVVALRPDSKPRVTGLDAATARCPSCGTALTGKTARGTFVRGVQLGDVGAVTTDELRCGACVRLLSPAERAQWLPISDVAGE